MRFNKPILEGRLLRRYKRFLADVDIGQSKPITAVCPNTGSLLGCQQENARVLLRDDDSPTRKYRYTWIAIYVGRTLGSIDTAAPNGLVEDAIRRRRIPELAGYESIRREVRYGQEGSRIDLLLERGEERCWVEVKSTTLCEQRVAMFPDAVTERGRKHLRELMAQVAAGDRAVQFFFVQRRDCDTFRPAWHIDPAYCETLAEAQANGVELLAYGAQVRRDGITLGQRLEIDLRR